MFHLAAFYDSVDAGGLFVALPAVNDPALTTAGNDVRVPAAAFNLVGACGIVLDTTVEPQAQLQSPSLRSFVNRDIAAISALANFAGYTRGIMHGDSPFPLAVNESLNFLVNQNPGGGVDNYGIIWLADGALQPVKGSIASVRATAAATLSAGVWVNSPLVFDQVLPAGVYQVVGMRAGSANLVAARLVFVGSWARPGVLNSLDTNTPDPTDQRYGALGVFGQFDSTTPPSVDCLGITDTAQEMFLDLLRVR